MLQQCLHVIAVNVKLEIMYHLFVEIFLYLNTALLVTCNIENIPACTVVFSSSFYSPLNVQLDVVPHCILSD